MNRTRLVRLGLLPVAALWLVIHSCGDATRPPAEPDSDAAPDTPMSPDGVPDSASDWALFFESEPNDLPEEANRFEVGAELIGRLETHSDEDSFVTWLERGALFRLEAVFSRVSEEVPLRLAKVEPFDTAFLSEPVPLSPRPLSLRLSPARSSATVFIPASGDYLVTLPLGSPASYRVRTSVHWPAPTPAAPTLPVRLPTRLDHQDVFSFTAPTDLVLTAELHISFTTPTGEVHTIQEASPPCFARGFSGDWTPGLPWAYHPTDPRASVRLGALQPMSSTLWSCGVPLRKGQEVLLVTALRHEQDLYFPDGDAATVFVPVEYASPFFALALSPDDTVDGDLGSRDVDWFLLEDAPGRQVTLTFETETPGFGGLELFRYYPYDRHGPMLMAIPFESTRQDGRVTMLLNRDTLPDPLLIAASDQRTGEVSPLPVSYSLTTTSASTTPPLLSAGSTHRLSLEASTPLLLRTAIEPGLCLFADLLDPSSVPPSAAAGSLVARDAVCGETERGALFACVPDTAPSHPLVFEARLDTGSPPSELLLRLATTPIADPDVPVIADAEGNDTPDAAQALHPPVTVAAPGVQLAASPGLADTSRYDYFEVALQRGEVLVAVFDHEPPATPSCPNPGAWTSLLVPWESPTPSCLRAPSVPPGAHPEDVNRADSKVLAYLAPHDMQVGVAVHRYTYGDASCLYLPAYTLKLSILPRPEPTPP